MLMKQNEYSSMFSSSIMALFGGMMSGMGAKDTLQTDPVIDKSEEDLLKKVKEKERNKECETQWET